MILKADGVRDHNRILHIRTKEPICALPDPLVKKAFHPFIHCKADSMMDGYSPGNSVMIPVDSCVYDMDCYRAGQNNNMPVAGTSCSGKSRKNHPPLLTGKEYI